MASFKVGDIVTGIPNNTYTYTSNKVKMEVTKSRETSDYMNVRILCDGDKIDNSDYFVKKNKFVLLTDNKDNKFKKMNMANIVKFAKNMTLSKDERLLREAGLKNECGEFTPEASTIVMEKLVKENKEYLLEVAKEVKKETTK